MDNLTKLLIIGFLAYVLYNMCSKESFKNKVENFDSPYPFSAPNMNALAQNAQKVDTPLAVSAPQLVNYQVNEQQPQTVVQVPTQTVAADKLTPEDLLPKDANSAFAQQVPTTGSLMGVNLIEAGYHIGTNTVASSLRNANYQVRSDPPIPKMNVGPFLNSTIEYDDNRRPFEIGSAGL